MKSKTKAERDALRLRFDLKPTDGYHSDPYSFLKAELAEALDDCDALELQRDQARDRLKTRTNEYREQRTMAQKRLRDRRDLQKELAKECADGDVVRRSDALMIQEIDRLEARAEEAEAKQDALEEKLADAAIELIESPDYKRLVLIGERLAREEASMKLRELAEKAARLPEIDFDVSGWSSTPEYWNDDALSAIAIAKDLPGLVDYLKRFRNRMREQSDALCKLRDAYEAMRKIILEADIESAGAGDAD